MSDNTPKKPTPPKLTIDAEIGLGHYSNFVSIAHNYSEVLMDFGRTLPGRKDIPVVSRIIMNPFQAKQLLRALEPQHSDVREDFRPDPQPTAAGNRLGSDQYELTNVPVRSVEFLVLSFWFSDRSVRIFNSQFLILNYPSHRRSHRIGLGRQQSEKL